MACAATKTCCWTTHSATAARCCAANAALPRINFVNHLLFWNGSAADADVPNALGTRVNLSAFTADADDPAKLVERLALGESLLTASRNVVIWAVSAHTQQNNGNGHRTSQVRQAAHPVFASPNHQAAR